MTNANRCIVCFHPDIEDISTASPSGGPNHTWIYTHQASPSRLSKQPCHNDARHTCHICDVYIFHNNTPTSLSRPGSLNPSTDRFHKTHSRARQLSSPNTDPHAASIHGPHGVRIPNQRRNQREKIEKKKAKKQKKKKEINERNLAADACKCEFRSAYPVINLTNRIIPQRQLSRALRFMPRGEARRS